MRQMIERGGVRVVELDALHKLLLVQPEITTAARVGAGLKHVARNLRGLLGETYFASPGIGHVDVQQNAGRKTFLDDERYERDHKIRGRSEVDFLGAIGN